MAVTEIEEHTFTYGEKKTFYLAAGPSDGTLLIFLHGWPAIAKTWTPQLEAFALLGFRTIAPDIPGYGGSTSNKVVEDYSMEVVNKGMLELLKHLGRDTAIWFGHDWGCPSVWSFAAHYPEHVIAVGGIATPYGVNEVSLEEEVKTVNRDIYPADEYPYGQWAYQRYYELHFDKATAFFETDPAAVLRMWLQRGKPEDMEGRAVTADVLKDGGWFGGVEKPDPAWRNLPIEDLALSEDMFQDVVHAFEKSGFWGPNAYYLNHGLNKEYFDRAKNDAYLDMPVLFIEGAYDVVCATNISGFADNQRRLCRHLTETSIPAGHWVAQEQPGLVNAAIAKWLSESVKDHWPITWTRTPN